MQLQPILTQVGVALPVAVQWPQPVGPARACQQVDAHLPQAEQRIHEHQTQQHQHGRQEELRNLVQETLNGIHGWAFSETGDVNRALRCARQAWNSIPASTMAAAIQP